MREINEESYLRYLADAGFRLDFVTPSKVYCLEGAASCVVRPFSRHFSPMGPEKAALFGIKRFE